MPTVWSGLLAAVILTANALGEPNQNISLVSEALVTGDYTDVKCVDDRIWCTNKYGVVVYTFDDDHPDNPPVEIARFPTPGLSQVLFVQDTLCYVADGERGLEIYDVSDLNAVEEVGVCEDATYAWSVTVGDGTAYVAAARYGVYAVDVSDPRNPSVSGFYEETNEGRTMILQDDILWMTTGRGYPYLTAIDVSDPINMSQISRFDDEYTGEFGINGNVAFICADGLHSLNISDPRNIRIIDDLDGVGGAAYYSEGYVYGDAGGPGYIADASDPTNLIFLSRYGDDGLNPKAIAVRGNYLFGSAHERGLKVVSVEDKRHPRVLHINLTSGQPVDLVRQGDYLYVADQLTGNYPDSRYYPGRLRIFDVTDVRQPRQAAMVDSVRMMSDRPFSCVLLQDTLAVLGGGPLRIYNISDPTNPISLYNPPDPGFASGSTPRMTLAGDYMLNTDYYLFVTSLRDPRSPEAITYYDFGQERLATNVFVSGEYLLVPSVNWNTQQYMLLTYDWSDPENIQQVGEPCDLSYYSEVGVLNGDYLYLMQYQGYGLTVVNVSDLEHPEVVYYGQDLQMAYSAKVYGDYLYVADGWEGIRIFDIEDPENPQQVAYYDTPDLASALDVDPDKGFIYVADYDDISIYDCGRLIGTWDLALSDSSHDFGAVTVDSTLRWDLVLTNNCNRSLHVDSIRVTGGSFHIDNGDGFDIEFSADTILQVGFTPDTAGVYQGRLTIYSVGRILTVALSGIGEPLSVAEDSALPTEFELFNPYPNPFNNQAQFVFALPAAAEVRLVLYDINGREVATITKGHFEAGLHRVTFDGKSLTAGVYFVRLEAEGRTVTIKTALVK